MTKADFVDILHERIGFSKCESVEIIEELFTIIRETLIRHEKVKLSGFGNFIIHTKHARQGRNPQTGGKLMLAPRTVVTFKASQILRKTVNG